jgi:predicted DNA-binding transcriptional regulator YafY
MKTKRMTSKSKSAGISEKVIRLLKIYTLIAQKTYPTIQGLAEEFHVSERTIYRYLEIIDLIDPIETDEDRRGYRFTSGDRIKKVMLDEREFLFLLAMGETVSNLGPSFREGFQHLVTKMAYHRKRPSRGQAVPIVVKIPGAVESEALTKYLTIISGCIEERRCLDIVYMARHSKETTARTVDPYGLVFYEGVWILVGYCNLRKQIRSFALDRIKGLKERYRFFEPKTGFDLKEHISRSWGIYDDEEVTVTMRFNAEVGDYVLRKKWHPSEKKRDLPEGDVELTFTVAGTGEIKKWIYSWLPDVEVLKPEWFRKQVQEELSAALGVHSK